MYKGKLDPITFAVVQSKVNSIVHETLVATWKSGHSTMLNAGRDFSVTICDSKCRLVSIAEGLPVHVMTSNMAVEPIAKLFDDIAPGDVFLNNSPYYGGAHHADYNYMAPVFNEGKLMFWVILREHQHDVGGPSHTTYFPYAKDVYEEGLHWPCVRLRRNYKDIKDVIRIALQAIRCPDVWYANYVGALGALSVAERRLGEILTKYGNDVIGQWIEEWMDYGDRAMTNEIRSLPKGTWEYETRGDPLSYAPEGVYYKAKLTIDPDAAIITIDLSECQDQVEGGINLTEAMSKCVAMEGLFWCLDPTLPHNSGAFSHIKCNLREGSVAGIPKFPVGTSVSTCSWADRVANMSMALMAQVDPRKGSAEGGLFGHAWAVVSGNDPRRKGEYYQDELYFAQGGGPGTDGYDGWVDWASAANQGATYIESVEAHELHYPHMVDKEEVAIDSVGAGEYNGSPGIDVIYYPVDAPFTVAGFFEGGYFPHLGALGGEPGTLNKACVIDLKTRETVKEVGTIDIVEVKEGQALFATGNSGAGFGNPLERDPERVRIDVQKGWVSVEKARNTYGVVVSGSDPEEFTVDYEATRILREQKREEQAKRGTGE